MSETMRVPLKVSWLSENDLLPKAAAILGYAIVPGSATSEGVNALSPGGSIFTMRWETDELLFDLSQLAELGFDIGDVVAIGRAVADKEMTEVYDANHAMAARYDNCPGCCRQCGGHVGEDKMGEGGICKQCWDNKDPDKIKIIYNETEDK